MPRPRSARIGAAAIAALLLPAPAPAQKFPGNLPYGPPGYGYQPPQEGGQPYPYGPTAKFDRPRATPRPRQAAAPPAATPVQADLGAEALRLQAEDPPAVVGRVARVAGTASLRLSGSEDWRPATLNTAIVPGNALWTEPGARLAVEAGNAGLFLDGGTALQIDALDEQGLRATLAQGSVFLRLSGMETFGGTADVATPEASVATAIDSRILIQAAAPDGSRPGRVAVLEGGAEVTLASSAEPIRLGPGQAISLQPGGAIPAIEPAGPPEPLVAWALGAEPRMPLPAAVRGMTGAAELGQDGRWDRSPDYGEVWYPPVAQDWVPYSDGSWEWRDPWGWTWVDAAPWGFVTAHYGRWVRIGPRWGWAPAPVPVVGLPPLRPVWAPALVTFFAPPPAYGFGRPVGWIPLGPREAWYPWYRCSPAYVARVNVRQVPYVAPVSQRWTAWGGPERRWAEARWDGARPGGPEDRRLDAYRNRAAATLVPDRAMLASLPVRAEARRADPRLLRQAGLPAALPPRPAPETRGLTERGAERLGLPGEAWRAARPDHGAGPPAAIRAALPEPRPAALRPPRSEEGVAPRGAPAGAPDLRQRLLEDQARRQQQAVPRMPAEDPAARLQRGQEMRQRQLEQQSGRGPGGAEPPRFVPGTDPRGGRDPAAALRPQEMPRDAADKFGRPQPDPRTPPRFTQPELQRRPDQAQDIQRQQMEQARRQQDQAQQQMQRQQMEQARRQQEQAQQQMQRQQMEQARRQQEPAQQQMQRQQVEQARRQQEQAQQQMQRQEMEQARRQQEQAQQQMQRQQMEQARRQQEQAQQQMQRQQMEQVRRQQEQAQQQMQRQQVEQARRQQEQAQQQMQRQQVEQARRQQEQAQQQMQRQQVEQARRQQEQAQQQMQRQQAAQAQRQQQRRDPRMQ